MKTTEETEVAAALPVGDVDDDEKNGGNGAVFDRESMVLVDAVGGDEDEGDEDANEEAPAAGRKSSRLKALAAVAGFAVGVVLLATGVTWFFRMGVFAEAKKQPVDRTSKSTNPASAPVSEDEKLKMALNMVAEKAAAATAASPSPSPVNVSDKKAGSISPEGKGPEPPSLLLPGETVPSSPASSRPEMKSMPSSLPSSSGGGGGGPVRSSSVSGPSTNPAPARTVAARVPQAEPVLVRPIYFGPADDESKKSDKPEMQKPALEPVRMQAGSTQSSQLPFGTFLPVRILGAVYAVQSASGSLVRMELTQAVETGEGGTELPAGTIVVGRVKGSELNRILVGVVGLIDPATGGLLSFEGELVGGDGAAGVEGRRRSVRSGWSKLLAGLREAGSTAIGALGGLMRGGGTVVIADRAAGSVGTDVAEIIRRDRASEYVEVAAGTNAFVLVTQLPGEVSDAFRAAAQTR